jgi:hypothetical protein
MRRALLLTLAALGAAVSLRAQQVTARVGGELTGPPYSYVFVPVTVDMSASGGQLLGSYTARLTWNPSLFYYNESESSCCGQADSSAQGNFAAPYINSDSAYSYGVLKFSAVSPTGAGGLITIANLRFYAYPDTIGNPIGLSFSEMSAAGTFTNLLPILTTQGGTFCTSRGRWGDLDRDGNANSRDALFVLSKVVGLPVDTLIADTSVADVDADGRTTSRDALVILSFAVGIPVPGQRVLLPVANAACATGSARQIAVLPNAVELVVNQLFKFTVQATDSAGRAVSVSGATWRSSDFSIAAVEADGTVEPRAAGTATITAEIGPGVQASATVTVIARRPNWYVDIAATGRPVQNGSALYPYESPLGAFRWVAEGDTVRVASGTYYFDNDGELNVGVVIQGGTPGDTTTRPVFRDAANNYYALWLRGGQRTVVRNVVFQNFSEGIELDGVRNLAVEDTKFLNTGSSYMDGIYHCGADMDTIRIDRSEFIGNPQYRYGDAVYVSGCSQLAVRTMLFRDSRIQYMSDALYMYGVDSLVVLRSQIIDNGGYGISMSQEYNETPALYMAHSRIERNRYYELDLDYMRRIVIDTSVIRADSGYGLYLSGDYYTENARIYLRGDSIYHDTDYSYDWLRVYDTDSLVIEDVVVRAPDDTSTYVNSYINADVAIVRRSKFLNLGGYYPAFYFDGRRLLADSVTMTGCAVANCDQSYGFNVYASGVGASSSILRSSFSRIYQPILLNGTGSVHEVRSVTIDSASYGIQAYSVDSVAVTDNVMTRVSYRGVDLYSRSGSRGPSLVARNNITCTTRQFYQAGVAVTSFGAVVDQDTVTGCRRGVELNTVAPGTRVRRSTLRSNSYGVYVYQYIDPLLIPVDTNGISGSDTAAVYVDYARVSLFHNRIENDSNGVLHYGGFAYVLQLHDNAFVNNTGWSILSSNDSVDASANYWGPSGGPPPTTLPNGVSGSRINTSGALSTPPADLPGLAPPSFVVASVAATAAAPPAARREAPPPPPVRAARVRPALAAASAPNRTPERVAQIEAGRQRREAQEARRAEREVRVAAEREALRAAREAQRAGSVTPAIRRND